VKRPRDGGRGERCSGVGLVGVISEGDSLTVVQDARGRPLTKSFRRLDGRIVKNAYPHALDFRAYVVEVDGIASLAAVLDDVATVGHAAVIQCSSKTFSRQSITGADRRGNPISAKMTHEAARLRREVLDLLRLLPGDVLLVTYKQAGEILRDDLPPHVAVAHFGALRGLNSYEYCETAVVMGREQPSAQAIEMLTRPFTAPDPEPFLPVGEYVLQARGRRMRNGGPNLIEVQVHPDRAVKRCSSRSERQRSLRPSTGCARCSTGGASSC
jgi:hypothetical protein